MKVNLKAIADSLNLSISTVSKALNNSHEISTVTKKRVIAKAKEHNYQANPLARALRNNKSYTIAIVFPEIDNNFFSLIIKGVENVAHNKKYNILIYPTNESYKREKSSLALLGNGRVDGVMISLSSETKETSHIEALIKENTPIVLFDRVNDKIQLPKVVTDDYESAFKATKYLLDGDCRRIAFLSFSKHLYINKKRVNGYRDAYLKTNILPDPSLVISCGNNDQKNKETILNLLKFNRPDAIVASVEKLIAPCYDSCKKLNIKIPDDIKLIGYSNSQIAEFLNPSLSTIVQPAFEMGKEAASILFKLIDKKYRKSEPESVVLSSEIFIRDSTTAM